MKLRFTTRAAIALLLVAAAPQVFAQATIAGTDITNSATVDYKVGTVDQDQLTSNTLTFEVDRKVDLIVTKTGDASASPNAQDEVLTFTVQNKTNDTIDIQLSTEDGGGTFTAANVQVWVEDGTTLGFQSGEDDQVSVLDALIPDQTKTVYIVADIPNNATDGQTDIFWLSAQARTNDAAAGTVGAAFVETADVDDPAVVDNVFADGDGPAAEIDQDGRHSDDGTYTVAAAALTVTKSYKVIFEDAANSANFSAAGEEKPIAGALVEYCILIENGTAVDAKSVTVTDVLGGTNTVAANATWVAESIRVNTSCDYGTGTANDDDAVDEAGDDDATGISASYNSGSGTVTSTVETLSGNTDTATMFRVILN